MNTIQCIKTRRSVRKFSKESISHEKIRNIIEAASYSPSWKNTSICRYIIIENQSIIKKIAENCIMDFEFNKKTLMNCNVLAVVTMVKGKSGYEKDGSYSTIKEDKWEMFDSGIASQTFCLAAWEYGIGTVIMGIFDEEKIEDVIEIPAGQKIAAIIAMGYPNENPDNIRRRTVDELTTFIE